MPGSRKPTDSTRFSALDGLVVAGIPGGGPPAGRKPPVIQQVKVLVDERASHGRDDLVERDARLIDKIWWKPATMKLVFRPGRRIPAARDEVRQRYE